MTLTKAIHRHIERRTGLAFGTYRASDVDGPTWLVIAPPTEDRVFSVVVGRRGFYVGRLPR